jgi:protein involved in polysaccharide export with SLBB domain
LNDLDSVVIYSKLLLKPVVFFEGAIGSKREAAIPPESNRIRYAFFPGEQISSPVRSFNDSGLFTAESALDKSYIIREGEAQPLAINLEMLLYNYQPENDKDLHSGDLIIIPFRQYSITVGGAVNKPGRYPYVPNRSWRYYVNLAGGIDEDKNAGDAIVIRDIEDQVKLKDSEIQPEDKIVALANNPLYIFGKFSVILTSVVSLTSLVMSVIVLFK